MACVDAHSKTRASMPSYRPQANTRCSDVDASDRAMDCVKGVPAGVGTTRVDEPSGRKSASSACAHGSGFITMPAPPPYGVSSTVRCRSVVHDRRSCTCRSSRPPERALPSRDTSSTEKNSGKIVTMSIRTGTSP